MHRKSSILLAVLLAFIFSFPSTSYAVNHPRELKGAYRLPAKNGWTYVHLQGTPHDIGFQNGYLLASEIEDTLKVVMLESKHDYNKDWSFFRDASENMMWPHIEQEYREELQGIADGAAAHGVKVDVWDIVGINAQTEWEYYNKSSHRAQQLVDLYGRRTVDHHLRHRSHLRKSHAHGWLAGSDPQCG